MGYYITSIPSEFAEINADHIYIWNSTVFAYGNLNATYSMITSYTNYNTKTIAAAFTAYKAATCPVLNYIGYSFYSTAINSAFKTVFVGLGKIKIVIPKVTAWTAPTSWNVYIDGVLTVVTDTVTVATPTAGYVLFEYEFTTPGVHTLVVQQGTAGHNFIDCILYEYGKLAPIHAYFVDNKPENGAYGIESWFQLSWFKPRYYRQMNILPQGYKIVPVYPYNNKKRISGKMSGTVRTDSRTGYPYYYNWSGTISIRFTGTHFGIVQGPTPYYSSSSTTYNTINIDGVVTKMQTEGGISCVDGTCMKSVTLPDGEHIVTLYNPGYQGIEYITLSKNAQVLDVSIDKNVVGAFMLYSNKYNKKLTKNYLSSDTPCVIRPVGGISVGNGFKKFRIKANSRVITQVPNLDDIIFVSSSKAYYRHNPVGVTHYKALTDHITTLSVTTTIAGKDIIYGLNISKLPSFKYTYNRMFTTYDGTVTFVTQGYATVANSGETGNTGVQQYRDTGSLGYNPNESMITCYRMKMRVTGGYLKMILSDYYSFGKPILVFVNGILKTTFITTVYKADSVANLTHNMPIFELTDLDDDDVVEVVFPNMNYTYNYYVYMRALIVNTGGTVTFIEPYMNNEYYGYTSVDASSFDLNTYLNNLNSTAAFHDFNGSSITTNLQRLKTKYSISDDTDIDVYIKTELPFLVTATPATEATPYGLDVVEDLTYETLLEVGMSTDDILNIKDKFTSDDVVDVVGLNKTFEDINKMTVAITKTSDVTVRQSKFKINIKDAISKCLFSDSGLIYRITFRDEMNGVSYYYNNLGEKVYITPDEENTFIGNTILDISLFDDVEKYVSFKSKYSITKSTGVSTQFGALTCNKSTLLGLAGSLSVVSKT